MKIFTFNIPVYSETEFLDIVLQELFIDNETLVQKGFPKWNKDDPRPFINMVCFRGIKSLPQQYVLDTRDSEWIWMVNMTEAMLMRRPVEKS